MPRAANLPAPPPAKPSRAAVEDAVRTLIAWAGDDPAREGLAATPQRVADAFREYFSGYDADARRELLATFETAEPYDDMVLLKDIHFDSHCEHHIAPFSGVAHIAYIPAGRIVGLSRLARVVEICARRLQTQENLTAEIAAAIDDALKPKGVAVMLTASHSCVSARSVRQAHATTTTLKFTGTFLADPRLRDRFTLLAVGAR